MNRVLFAGFLIFLGALTLRLFSGTPGAERQRLPSTTVGHFLPDLRTLVDDYSTPNGSVDSQGTLIVAVDADDCLSCLNLATEVQIIRREYPQLSVVGIAIGEGETEFAHFFRQARVSWFRDPDSRLAGAMGSRHTPLVLVIDNENRILFVDGRVGPQTAATPISEVFVRLGRLIAPTLAGADEKTAGRLH